MKLDFEEVRREIPRDGLTLAFIALASFVVVPVVVLLAQIVVPDWKHHITAVLLLCWLVTVPLAVLATMREDLLLRWIAHISPHFGSTVLPEGVIVEVSTSVRQVERRIEEG